MAEAQASDMPSESVPTCRSSQSTKVSLGSDFDPFVSVDPVASRLDEALASQLRALLRSQRWTLRSPACCS